MDWCSVYLTPQALPKYIYLSPPLIFPITSTELGQKTTRCESLRALLHYVEWDRIVTLSQHKRTEGYVIVSSVKQVIRRFWRCKRGKQNPYIEEQTTQWPKEKVQKDKQRSTKNTHKTKDWVTRTPLKTRGELVIYFIVYFGIF